MADKRITELQPLDAASVQSEVDVLAIADVSAAETKKVKVGDLIAAGFAGVPDGSIPGSKIEPNTITSKEIAPNAVGASELADNAVDTGAIRDGAVTTEKLADGSVTNDKLADDSVTTDKLADGAVGDDQIADRSITAVKLVQNTLTRDEIAPNAITASELANNAVDTGAIQDGAVTAAKLADDAKKLAPDSVTDVELADNAVDTAAIQDKAVTQAKLADNAVGTEQLADGAVTADKIADGALGTVSIADRSIPAIKLVQNTLTADEIAPNAIGASELANNAVDTPALADNAVSTPKLQDASVTEPKLADGAVTTDKIADGAVTVNKLGDGVVTDDKIDGIGLDKLPDAPSGTVLAGPVSGAAASPTYRRLEPSDIPTATQTEKGGVSIPASGGLAVDGAGAVGIGNSVTPNEFPVISYNEHGLVTNGRALSNSDLPPPALGEIGGVKAGDGITITPDGTISQSLTGVVADTYTKVTVDEMGSVTAGAELVADDIPNIPWDKIENPVITPSELSDKSVQLRHLANYSIAFIQEDQPLVTNPELHAGCLWFQESTATLHMYNQNSWLSVGIGRLSAENLRYCGLINADTATITAVTQFGVAEGFEVGDAIPDPSDELTGVYFIAEVAGSGINKTAVSGKSFDEGDWLICNGAASGWERIDTSAGGSGGGGASRLEDLLDVNVSTKQPGALLQYQANGTWQDIYAVDAGTY